MAYLCKGKVFHVAASALLSRERVCDLFVIPAHKVGVVMLLHETAAKQMSAYILTIPGVECT